MESAIDLFRAGAAVTARETDHAAVALMRTVCPECMERVRLVVRENTAYFAHEEWTAGSPPCALRVEPRGGSSRGAGGPREPLPPNTRFRDALLAAYALAEPPGEPAGGPDLGRAAALMRQALRERGRTVAAADLPDASPLLRDWWRSDEEMIRGFLDRPGVVRARLREDLRDDPGLQTDAHRRSVLLLWRHLHLPQVAEDLGLLLRVTARLFQPALLADLVITGLGVLAWVPWDVLWAPGREHVCDDCGKTFALPAAAKPAVCSECSKTLCPDCADQCSGCSDVLCEGCIHDSCNACQGVLCMACSHFDWECAWCHRWFCEGGFDEEPPEPMDKVECDGCHETYCVECERDALQDVGGDALCESCREEREAEREEAAAEERAAAGDGAETSG